MKIIRQGSNDYKKDVKRFTCDNCGCVFEASSNEYRYADQMAYVHDGIEAMCTCPYCRRTAYKIVGRD